MLIQKIKFFAPLTVVLALASAESNAGAILHEDLAKLTVFSNEYTTTGANSIVYGNILAGGVSTTGANAIVYGYVVSVGAANIGGGTSKVSGNVVSGGVMTVGGATTVGSPGPNVTGSITSTGASTIGDFAQVGGDMLSGGAATTGANSVVGGSVLSNGAATTGDNAKVHGDVSAAGISTIGAHSVVDGNVNGSGNPATNVISASATVGSQNNVTTSPDLSAVRAGPGPLAEAGQVKAAQATLSALGVGTPLATPLAATMTIDTTFAAGIYSAPSFSTTKGTTMTLQGDGTDDLIWVFNIADVLAFGADTTITMSTVGANARVYWNSYNGYITSGAGADVIGTLLAHQHIAIGAYSTVRNSENSCGAVYSATSYVSTGDSAEIGGKGCSPVVSVPEPATFGMLLSALAFLGFKRSRKG
ncbi:MAG: hypothetical protein ACI9WS_001905 [Paraglaciecola psychrophila]|jgi:hypothetical protein